MTSEQSNADRKALVTVFEDLETAAEVVEALHSAGFSTDNMELVTRDLQTQSPDVKTPNVHETTASSLAAGAEKWGAMGAGTGAVAGLLATVLTSPPGIILGMIIMGGFTGALMGGISGLEHAAEDDAVNLPTIEEYNKLLQNGNKLVVVHGTHEEMERAKGIVSDIGYVHNHIHPIQGHEFHEHPSN